MSTVDISKIMSGQAKDVLLKPNDIIYVPEKKWLGLEELSKLAIRTYVSKIASDAGSYSWQKIKPGSPSTDTSIPLD